MNSITQSIEVNIIENTISALIKGFFHYGFSNSIICTCMRTDRNTILRHIKTSIYSSSIINKNLYSKITVIDSLNVYLIGNDIKYLFIYNYFSFTPAEKKVLYKIIKDSPTIKKVIIYSNIQRILISRKHIDIIKRYKSKDKYIKDIISLYEKLSLYTNYKTKNKYNIEYIYYNLLSENDVTIYPHSDKILF